MATSTPRQITFCLLVVAIGLHIPGVVDSSNRIGLNTIEINESLAINCTYDAPLTFQFKGKYSNSTINIAACETVLRTCFLMRDDLRETYQIRYTETGGILIILNHTETIHGMYKCCETYRPDNFVDTSIPPQDASSSLTTTVGSEQVVTSRCQQSSPPSTTRESKTASSSLVSITMCLAIIAIVLAVISFGFSMKKILLFSNKDNQRNCVSALKYTALSSSDIHVA